MLSLLALLASLLATMILPFDNQGGPGGKANPLSCTPPSVCDNQGGPGGR